MCPWKRLCSRRRFAFPRTMSIRLKVRENVSITSTRSEISPPLRSSSRTPCWRFSRHSHGVPVVRDTDRLLCGLAHLLHQRRGVGRLYIFCSQWLRSHAALFRLAGDRRHASVQPFSAARAAGDRKLCFFREIVHFFGGKNITASAIPRTDWLADGWRPENDLWSLRDAAANGIF